MISCHEYERVAAGFVFAVVNCLYKHPVLHTFVTWGFWNLTVFCMRIYM